MSEPAGPRFAVVIPSIGRPSLFRLLETLAAQDGPLPVELVVADDRPPRPEQPGRLELPALPVERVRVVRTQGRGPAAARNAGWRSTSAPWVVFLDDDVELPDGWARALVADLAATAPDVAGNQGRLRVPLPAHRPPTDWERGTAGLQDAAWATADMAYRRTALEQLHGFDERFPRAYREDADLALRALRTGWRLTRGERVTVHPVRPADDLVSLRVQRGNADDVLMRALHGPQWRSEGDVPRGAFPRHVATVAAAAVFLTGLGARFFRHQAAAAPSGIMHLVPRRSSPLRSGGLLAGGIWALLTADFLRRRLHPGPRPGDEGWAGEYRRMLITSLAIPPAAVVHRLRGAWRWRHGAAAWPPPIRAVLFDRDGTLVHDEPYNGDPAKVRLMPGARAALDQVRAAGLRTGVVSNQSGVARGLIDRDQVHAVNSEIDRQLGGLGTWQYCPHGPDDRCGCRKPEAGLILEAARALGVEPYECLVIGDIGADVEAAMGAGARPVLVPTAVTRREEIEKAPQVAGDLAEAVRIALRSGGRRVSPVSPVSPVSQVTEVTGVTEARP